MAQCVTYLLCRCKALSLDSQVLLKPSVLVHASNPRAQLAEAGGSEAQGHPQLHSKYEASLRYLRPYHT